MRHVLIIFSIFLFSLTIISCSSDDGSKTTGDTTTVCPSSSTNYTAPIGGPSCTAAVELPTISGCSGVDLTAASSIDTQSSGIISTPNGLGSSTVLRIENEQYIDLKDEGCLQLGKDGGDFALSMWLKVPGASADHALWPESQIIGTKSQFSQQTPGWLLHTKLANTLGYTNAPDGWLILTSLSSPPVNSQRKYVYSSPFPPDTWTHVVLNYQNDDYNNSKFSIYVNLIGDDNKGSRAGAHPNIYTND